MTKVAFIGLGVMGYPMAGHLSKHLSGHLSGAGQEVCVYNRTQARAEQWCNEYNGTRADTPAQAAVAADYVFCCVGNDHDLRQVIADPHRGALAGMGPGSCLVDHTTASQQVAVELAAMASGQGVDFIDAPVSGGQAGAENGQLAIMCGARSEQIFARAQAVMQCYAKSCVRIGDIGHGQLAKMMNQIAIAGLVQSLSEAIAFGQQAGVDIPKVMEVITGGAAASWQMDNRWQTMLNDEFDFGFAVDWMRKDLAICLDTARENGAKLPITALVDQFYAQIQARGGNRWDTSSLIRLLKQKE